MRHASQDWSKKSFAFHRTFNTEQQDELDDIVREIPQTRISVGEDRSSQVNFEHVDDMRKALNNFIMKKVDMAKN